MAPDPNLYICFLMALITLAMNQVIVLIIYKSA